MKRFAIGFVETDDYCWVVYSKADYRYCVKDAEEEGSAWRYYDLATGEITAPDVQPPPPPKTKVIGTFGKGK